MSAGSSERRPHRGFTLVESIATIVVLAIVSSVSSGIILQATDGYIDATTHAQLHAETSIAMDRAVREVRRIPLDEVASGIAPAVNLVTATYIGWDTNSYLQFSGSDLALKLNGTPRPLIGDVTSFTVQTYDESNTALGPVLAGAACDPIRRIELTMSVSRHGVDATVRTKVFVRSTMSGASP